MPDIRRYNPIGRQNYEDEDGFRVAPTGHSVPSGYTTYRAPQKKSTSAVTGDGVMVLRISKATKARMNLTGAAIIIFSNILTWFYTKITFPALNFLIAELAPGFIFSGVELMLMVMILQEHGWVSRAAIAGLAVVFLIDAWMNIRGFGYLVGAINPTIEQWLLMGVVGLAACATGEFLLSLAGTSEVVDED